MIDNSLEITIRRHVDATIVAASGSVDALTCKQLEKILSAQIDGSETRIILDFSGVPYIVSAGLHMLLRIRALIGHDGHVAVCHPSQSFHRLLEASGLSCLLAVHADLDSACAALPSARSS